MVFPQLSIGFFIVEFLELFILGGSLLAVILVFARIITNINGTLTFLFSLQAYELAFFSFLFIFAFYIIFAIFATFFLPYSFLVFENGFFILIKGNSHFFKKNEISKIEFKVAEERYYNEILSKVEIIKTNKQVFSTKTFYAIEHNSKLFDDTEDYAILEKKVNDKLAIALNNLGFVKKNLIFIRG